MTLITPLRRLLLALPVALLLAAAPAPAGAATPAVNIDSPADQRVDAALATGAKVVRMFVLWSQLEPSARGTYPLLVDPGAANAQNMYDRAIRRLNAGGAKPLFVVLGVPSWANGSSDHLVPPRDPADFGSFFGRFVQRTSSVGQVAGYEVWNEQDGKDFWHGDVGPHAYGPMLRASYDAGKPWSNGAPILVGATTGNNHAFIQGLYDNGLKGKFDGVSVHTDTACLNLGPDFYYRESPSQRVGQYTFLGYRTVHDVMVANGDGHLPIWMTEMGWSATNGGPTSCQRGTGAGVRPSGVTEAQQAAFLEQAFGCMARDPYVATAAWFTLHDGQGHVPDELNHYGLIDNSGRHKPAYEVFRRLVAAGGGGVGPCGDFSAPTVDWVTPNNIAFTKSVLLEAKATDTAEAGVKAAGMNRISFSVDGKAFYRFSSLKEGQKVSLNWLRAADLPDGEHIVTAEAVDKLGNVSRKDIKLLKGLKYASAFAYGTRIKMAAKGKKVSCRGRACRITGRLTGPAGYSLAGRVRVEWQLLVRQRLAGKRYRTRYTTFHKGGSAASKPFAFQQRLKRGGRWRVRVFYEGAPPLRKSTTTWNHFKV